MGGEGRLRLHLPVPHFADYLGLALDEADQYGAESRQVQQRIDALLVDLRAAALTEHQPPLDARLARRKRLPAAAS